MGNTVWVNADHGRDLHPLADWLWSFKGNVYRVSLHG